MPNYIVFRDVGSVLAAGNTLVSQGGALNRAVAGSAGSLRATSVFTRKDGYSQDFWTDNYAAVLEGADGPRHEDLLEMGRTWATDAETIGKNVVTATTTILWQDAIAAAELASARAT
jgi:hypothetical protein